MYSSFIQEGYYQFPELLSPDDATLLYKKIRGSRSFGPELFIDEADWNPAIGQLVNPEASDINLLNSLDKELGFVERNPIVTDALKAVLGDDYTILLKKVICGVRQEWMPAWVWAHMKDAPYVKNLGSFIKPEYRDITYFFGINFHQDNVDIKDSNSEFITMYVYLDEVTEKSSPLYIIPGSHQYGVALFPYELEFNDTEDGCTYHDGAGRKAELPINYFTGPPGTAAFWHSGVMHGSYPDEKDSERISLRYLIKKNTSERTLLDETNDKIDGPLSLRGRYELRREWQKKNSTGG